MVFVEAIRTIYSASLSMTCARQFGIAIDKCLHDGVCVSRVNDVVVHLKGDACFES